MRVAVKKIDGVKSVEVSLNHGVADIILQPDNAVSLDRIRQIVLDNGFSPREAEVVVKGHVMQKDSQPVLKVSGLKDVIYPLTEAPEAKGKMVELLKTTSKQTEKVVTIRGLIEQPKKPSMTPRLLVREFKLEGGE